MTDTEASTGWQYGYIAVRHLREDTWLAVAPLTYDRARLVICNPTFVIDSW